MDDAQEKVAVPTWRAFKVAPVAVTVMGRHRESVPGIALLESELVPALEVFLPAATGLRMFEATRVRLLERREQTMEELRRRTRFWLTYVRLDLPGYVASDMDGSRDNVDVMIDRARKLVDLAATYGDEPRPHYADQMAAEMAPLHERAVRERAEWLDSGLELQTLRRRVRTALVPVSDRLVLLRTLLRNALGGTHADVRALAIDPPAKRKPDEANAGGSDDAAKGGSIVLPETHTLTTGERMALGMN